MRQVSKNKIGLTLIEILISVFLMSIVFLAVSALYVANQTFYFSANDKIRIGYELQYAIDHIYKNVMQGIGDKNNSSIIITPGEDNLRFTIRHIDEEDPTDSPTYSDYLDDKEITYLITEFGTLAYTKVDLPTATELEKDDNMIPKVTLLFTDDPETSPSKFSMDGNILNIKLTAEFPLARAGGTKERLTLYSACYPRLESFR